MWLSLLFGKALQLQNDCTSKHDVEDQKRLRSDQSDEVDFRIVPFLSLVAFTPSLHVFFAFYLIRMSPVLRLRAFFNGNIFVGSHTNTSTFALPWFGQFPSQFLTSFFRLQAPPCPSVSLRESTFLLALTQLFTFSARPTWALWSEAKLFECQLTALPTWDKS